LHKTETLNHTSNIYANAFIEILSEFIYVFGDYKTTTKMLEIKFILLSTHRAKKKKRKFHGNRKCQNMKYNFMRISIHVEMWIVAHRQTGTYLFLFLLLNLLLCILLLLFLLSVYFNQSTEFAVNVYLYLYLNPYPCVRFIRKLLRFVRENSLLLTHNFQWEFLVFGMGIWADRGEVGRLGNFVCRHSRKCFINSEHKKSITKMCCAYKCVVCGSNKTKTTQCWIWCTERYPVCSTKLKFEIFHA